MSNIKRSITALVLAASMIFTLPLTAGAILADTAADDGSADDMSFNIRDANIFDALEILKYLAGMYNNAVQLTGKEDLSVFDALDILKGLVGMTDCVKIRLPAAVWEELPLTEIDPNARVSISPPRFDLRKTITGQDITIDDYFFNHYFFRGTIVGIKEYNHSWVDDEGNKHGPFRRTVIEAKVNKSYHGEPQIEGDIIRLYDSLALLSWNIGGFDGIKEGEEYVFSGCRVIDKKCSDYIEKYGRDMKNSDIEKYADAYSGGFWYNFFPVEDGKIRVYNGYFKHDENAMRKVIYPDYEVAKNGFGNVIMNIDDFEEAFLKLFENPENLPTLES